MSSSADAPSPRRSPIARWPAWPVEWDRDAIVRVDGHRFLRVKIHVDNFGCRKVALETWVPVERDTQGIDRTEWKLEELKRLGIAYLRGTSADALARALTRASRQISAGASTSERTSQGSARPTSNDEHK